MLLSSMISESWRSMDLEINKMCQQKITTVMLEQDRPCHSIDTPPLTVTTVEHVISCCL